MRWIAKCAGFSLAISGLAACATPGIEYTASVAPGNPQAAQIRSVAVERFRGPFSGWYAEKFEDMLASADYNGQSWFQVGLSATQSNVDGVYGGYIELSAPDVDRHYRTSSKCIEKDEETKKCLKKKDTEQVCVAYSIDVCVTTELLDVRSTQTVHSKTYYATDSKQECYETGRVEYRVRRQPGDPGKGKYRFAGEDEGRSGHGRGPNRIVNELTFRALKATLNQVRRDIAPYNRQARATILTKAENPGVQADPRFKQAVDGVRSQNLVAACQMFSDLKDAYGEAPAVLHNLGACSEAMGESARAQTYYSEAARVAQAMGDAPAKRIMLALERISSTRSDELVLNTLVPGTP